MWNDNVYWPRPAAQPTGGTKSSGQQTTTETTTDAFSLPIRRPPGPNADADVILDFVDNQLDRIGTEQEVLGGLKLLGGGFSQRMRGGEHPFN
jgi:hypothetical protein